MKYLLLLACLALLQGCAPHYQMPPKAQFNRAVERTYPPLTVEQKKPSVDLQSKCDEFARSSILKHCTRSNLELAYTRQAFIDAEVFEEVLLGQEAEEESDFSVDFALVQLVDESEEFLEGMAKAMLFGSTLGITPMTFYLEIAAEADLRWRGRLLKTYQYSLPMTVNQRLFRGYGEYYRLIAEHLAAAFIRDLQQDKAYSGEFLLSKLNASDYAADLSLPDRVLDYYYESKLIQLDPYLGARVRFQHARSSDAIEVHVYPVKEAFPWDDAEQALPAEMELEQSEARLAVLRAGHGNLSRPGRPEAIPAPEGSGAAATGLALDFTYEGKNGTEHLSQTRLFLKKDKIIKFRKTSPTPDLRHDLDQFAAALLPLLDPPGESVYMAELRLEVQKKNILSDD